MEEENTGLFPPQESSDHDFSFTSTTSTSSFATTFASASARSSLSLPPLSFSSSTSLISPLPHSRSNSSPHWSAIRTAASLSRDGNIHFRHLQILRHLGSGHLAKVFHCRLRGSDNFDFALKVVDLDVGTKLAQVLTEGRVLSVLDHPFLPTLYARLDASHYACFLIDYCPGGDLHSLLRRHPGHRLPLHVVRFFAAEVLLALEYLHALGFVYRDLKPENVLIRADGHVTLSDFDLCFSGDVCPSLLPRSSSRRRRSRRSRRPGGCFGYYCSKEQDRSEVEKLMEFVAEPEAAFSRACVGTHEYLAPEIVKGNGHGSGIDWWAFGVFVYELLYGRTPFKGSSKESTLKNVLRTKNDVEIRFPNGDDDGGDRETAAAKDLIRRLLVHDPKERMGSRRGAAEIKRHPFFEGIRWPLIRDMKPPVVVGPAGAVVARGSREGTARWLGRKWNSSVKTLVSCEQLIKFMGSARCDKRKVPREKSL